MTTEEFSITQLHDTYMATTGQVVSLTFYRQDCWRAFLRQNWGPQEVFMVVNYMKREFRDFWPKMVRFSRLIEQPEQFEEYLALARAADRNKKPMATAKSRVLAAVGRVEPKAQEAIKTPSSVLQVGYKRLLEEAGL